MRDSRLQAGTLLTQKVYPPCPCALLVPSNNGSCHLLRGLMTERLSEHLFRGLMTDRSREAPRGGGDGVRNKCSLKHSVISVGSYSQARSYTSALVTTVVETQKGGSAGAAFSTAEPRQIRNQGWFISAAGLFCLLNKKRCWPIPNKKKTGFLKCGTFLY